MTARPTTAFRVTLASFLVSFLVWDGVAAAARLQLRWTDNSDNESGFSIERRAGTTGTFAEIGRTVPDAGAYTDASLIEGMTYCYRLRAFNASGYSAYTIEACGSARSTPEIFHDGWPVGSDLWGPDFTLMPTAWPPLGSEGWGATLPSPPPGLAATGSESWGP